MISLPDFSDQVNTIEVHDNSTSIGISLNENVLLNEPKQANQIIPDMVDFLTAGCSSQGNAPSKNTMENFLRDPARPHTQNTQREIENFKESSNQLLSDRWNVQFTVNVPQINETPWVPSLVKDIDPNKLLILILMYLIIMHAISKSISLCRQD